MPRPAIVIQSDWLDETDSVLVCLMTTMQRDTPLYRLDIPATPSTGLREPSQAMVDKITAVRRDKCGGAIGRLGQGELISLDRDAWVGQCVPAVRPKQAQSGIKPRCTSVPPTPESPRPGFPAPTG